MNDNKTTPLRKILSLKRNNKEQYKKTNNTIHSIISNNNIDYINIIAKKDPIINKLQQKRQNILNRINILEERLLFISSNPLQSLRYKLKMEDTNILCEINNYMINNYNERK